MPELKHILEIAIFSLIFFTIGFYLSKYQAQKEKDEYKQSYKHMIENFLGLNVTHLHDSANLFNLIKNNSKEQNIKNFATGSAYHFRSIFNSLKKSILQIRDYDPDELTNSSLYKLIEKEEVNLKDLINLELFQLGNFSQIQVNDNTKGEYAFIHGNFELLSKVFLNLVENALKYSDEQIKISLNDDNNIFTVQIMSFGKSISDNISLKINNKIYDDIKGHGLSSLVDIMNYHDANIHITSLVNEGSSINLEFKKAVDMIQPIATIQPEKKPFTLKKEPILLAASFVLLTSSYLVLNSKQEKKFTQSKATQVQNISPSKIELQAKVSKQKTPKLLTKRPKTVPNEDLSHLDKLIDQETAKLDLNLDF